MCNQRAMLEFGPQTAFSRARCVARGTDYTVDVYERHGAGSGLGAISGNSAAAAHGMPLAVFEVEIRGANKVKGCCHAFACNEKRRPLARIAVSKRAARRL